MSATQRYRKKPVEITARQLNMLDYDEAREIVTWSNGRAVEDGIEITTLHGEKAIARHGDWIAAEPEPGRFYPIKPDVFAASYESSDGASTEDSNLVAHARRELARLGEDQDVVEWFVRVVREFSSFGHSGGSAAVCVPRLNLLLQYEPLTPLTDDPAEWEDRSEMSGRPWWQSIRNPRAMSHDGGRTYWLVSEDSSADEVTPVYHSERAA